MDPRTPLLDDAQEEKKMDDYEPIDRVVKHSFSKRALDAPNLSDSDDAFRERPPLHEFSTASPPLREKAQKPRPIVRYLGYTARTVLLDLPLFAVLLTYAATVWFRHVQDSYLTPQLAALVFSEERALTENTYYNRVCDASDMTTTEGADLFLPITATPEEAYQHQLKHGFTIFQGILQPATCENLRNFVVSRNAQLAEDEIIYVIENDKRYSFGLGTEEPSVTAALKELANSPRLRPALEAVLGPDPALIEMTAITSSYGAVAQWWHDDVIAAGSPVQFGRAFGPSYSIFVQLQNTTKEMGATEACPGTHFCASGAMENFCNSSGFQLVGDSGHWGQGDALLMNMNSWHRGAAHTDPNALDRVMLILTFVPKPVARAESRQLSQGITFSLRWDMWGHTLRDLAAADTAMGQPWATLRALGLYKSESASWGIDYVTSASIRTANQDNGFRPDDLEVWIRKGGFWFLPDWLENFQIDWDEGESWPEYVKGTQRLCEEFTAMVSKYTVTGYVALFFLFCFIPGKQHRLQCIRGAFVRLSLIVIAVYLLFHTAKTRVDRTGWAADIQAGRRYASTVEMERVFARDDIDGPVTYPTKHDVLIETRFGSEQLAMYNDFVTIGHPGNRQFRELVGKAAPVYGGYSTEFKDATALFIAETVATNHGRFLYQGPDGYWMWLSYEHAIGHVKRELVISSSGVVAALMQTARFIESNFKYGIHRKSALAIGHAVPLLDSLRKRLLKEKTDRKVQDAKPARGTYLKHVRTFSLPSAQSNARRTPRKTRLHVDPVIKPPYRGAWLSTGEVAESYEDNAWFYGVIRNVNAFGEYEMVYPDGSFLIVDQYSIRPFEEYYVGEHLECYVGEWDNFGACTLQQIFHDGTYYAILDGSNEELLGLALGDFRRPGARTRSKHNFVDNYH